MSDYYKKSRATREKIGVIDFEHTYATSPEVKYIREDIVKKKDQRIERLESALVEITNSECIHSIWEEAKEALKKST